MSESKNRFSAELAGSLTPELEGASHSAAHAALIRADHHHMVTVDLQFLLFSQKILDKLVDRLNRLKSL